MKGTSLGGAAKEVELRFEGEQVFSQRAIREAVELAATDPVPQIVPMFNGLAVDDIFQSIATVLTPEQMEFVVEVAAKGAVELSARALEVSECDSSVTPAVSDASAQQNFLQSLVRAWDSQVFATVPNAPDAAVESPQPLVFGCCIPWRWTTQSSWAAGGCGAGFAAADGTCKYNCTACTASSITFTRWPNCAVTWTATPVTGPCTVYRLQTAAGECP